MDDGFVYDIETTTGRFAVGIGSIVAKNTDSVFITLPPLSDYSKYGHPTEKQNICKAKLFQEAIFFVIIFTYLK